MAIHFQERSSLRRRAGTTEPISSSSSPSTLSSSLSLSLAPPLNSKPTLPLFLALLFVLQLPQSTSATPFQSNARARSSTKSTPLFFPRAEGDAQGGVNIAFIVAPVAIASLVLVLLLVMSVRRRPKWKAFFKRAFQGDVLSSVTEERAMTSTANSTPATTGSAGTGTIVATGLGVGGREQTEIERQRAIVLADARRNQRAERARRRGSQRSVKSLPVYRVDLDDSEMVLVK
ncbi:hypothetical protein BDY24DRAFT_384591 [Mrakia frigida]|uniref:uncharacterized protein n=1 Tax=Mrakia frigida TaxID=29902 RepID=UPI003FCC00FE